MMLYLLLQISALVLLHSSSSSCFPFSTKSKLSTVLLGRRTSRHLWLSHTITNHPLYPRNLPRKICRVGPHGQVTLFSHLKALSTWHHVHLSREQSKLSHSLFEETQEFLITFKMQPKILKGRRERIYMYWEPIMWPNALWTNSVS